MRIKAKKQPTKTPVDESEEGPVKPSCGFFRLWKRLFWKHRPRVSPAVTSPAVENLLARRLSKESGSRPTGIGKSGEGDYLVKIIDKYNVTVEEEVDLVLDRPSTPDLYLGGRGISPRAVDKMMLLKPETKLSAKEISQMLDIGSQLNGLLSDVRGLSRRMDNVIAKDGDQDKTRPAQQPEFTYDGIPKDCPFEEDDDSSVDFSDYGRDSESDAISWASSFSSPEPYQNAQRSQVLRVWD